MVKLAQNERIIGVVRKHWFLPLIHTINVTFLFVLPIALLYILISGTISNEIIDVQVTFGSPSFLVFGISLWGLILWLRFFSFWTDHHLDGWVITNKRIIDVEQHGFFRREVASFRVERLQDVTTEVHGIIATLFKFGDVHVQTAGTDREFVLTYAPDPKAVRRMILEQYDTMIQETPVTTRDADSVTSVK